MFSLVCAMRNRPRMVPKYVGINYSKVSRCGVNVRFFYNENNKKYERVENSWKKIHDHRLELDDTCNLDPDLMTQIKQWWIENTSITCGTVMKRVKELTTKMAVETGGKPLDISHLEALNALQWIRGSQRVDIDQINIDLDQVAIKYPDCFIEVFKTNPVSVFI